MACSKCNETGYCYPMVNGIKNYDKLVACDCVKGQREHEKMQRLAKFCELPPFADECSLDNYKAKTVKAKEALMASKSVLEGKLEWLVLCGRVDHGKTHLALAVCKEWLALGKTAKFVVVPDMLIWLKDAYEKEQHNSENPNFMARMNVLKNIQLLVLDDLGAEKPSVWATEQITSIIDHRYLYHLPMIITTNKSLDSLPGDSEGRIESRLKRHRSVKTILLDGPEFRTTKGTGNG